MNLWFRMTWLLLTAWLRPRITSPSTPVDLHFRVLPSDVDFNIHLTNGRYQAIADIGRMDLAIRAGLLRRVLFDRWAPIVSYSSVFYRRELGLGQKFRLGTAIIYWDADIQVFEHVFRPVGGRHDGQIAASVLCVAGMYDRKARAFVTSADLLAILGSNSESPPLTPRIAGFLEAYQLSKADAKVAAAVA